MANMIDTIEEVLNSLTDMDWGWWPFLFLRPEPDEIMDTAHVAKMTLYFGPMFSLIIVIFRSTISTINITDIVLTAIGMHVFFFVGYRLVFAVAWNRRARRMQSQNATG